MRKLTSGNKKVFLTFTLIIVIIIIVLLFALYEVLEIGKTEYEVANGMIFYDVDYSPITIKENGIVYKKWDKQYYINLEQEKKIYKLGTTGIGYNPRRINLNIYGDLYKVNLDSTVEKYTGENIIKDLTKNSLYKLGDRRYLVVGNKIENDTGSISTKNYLIIIIDKSGNTLLLNNEINYKTINLMLIKTADFTLDVSNERLLVNKNNQEVQIDLKKIIGSSNEYIEKSSEELNEAEQEENEEDISEESVEQPEENNNDGNNGTQIVTQNNSETIIDINSPGVNPEINNNNTINDKNNLGGNSSGIELPNNSIDKDNSKESNKNDNKPEETEKIKNETPIEKNVSLRGLKSGSTYIDIEYNVLDTQNKYQLVYVELEASNGENQLISLDKNKVSYRVNNLIPNTEYKVTMGYKEIVENNEIEDKIEDIMYIKTQGVNSNIEITRITSNKIYFNFKMDNNYVFDSAKLCVYKDDELVEEIPVDISSSITARRLARKYR